VTSPVPTSPPHLAEWILCQLLDPEDIDAILGDFAEEYHARNGTQANWFYWWQAIQSCLPLLGLQISRQLERSLVMVNKIPPVQNKRSFWVSLVALLPAFLLVTVGLLQSGFGITAPNDALDAVFQRYAVLKLIIHPLVLLGGLGIAVILNVLPAAQLHWSRESQSLSATITLKNNLLHWALIGISLLLLGIILLYSAVENFNIIPR
jgi:fatty acid desaturase